MKNARDHEVGAHDDPPTGHGLTGPEQNSSKPTSRATPTDRWAILDDHTHYRGPNRPRSRQPGDRRRHHGGAMSENREIDAAPTTGGGRTAPVATVRRP
jgi:hypothetical protein